MIKISEGQSPHEKGKGEVMKNDEKMFEAEKLIDSISLRNSVHICKGVDWRGAKK